MAVGGPICEFDIWLNSKLLEFNTDEGVFGSYIRGILEGEESLDDKTEALKEILSEITENNMTKLCQEILEKWQVFQTESDVHKKIESTEDMDVKLSKLMELQAQVTSVTRNKYTDEEKRVREAILQQYGQMSDEEGEAQAEATSETVKENGIQKNTNAALVHQAEREKREKAKLDSQKKKEKDKEDREKQKQMQQDKKEKRKTQKGERRR